MDPFTIMMMMGTSALPYIMGNNSSPPGMPPPQYPDAQLLNEFGATNDWTNENLMKMLVEAYGGVAANAPINATIPSYTTDEQKFWDMLTTGSDQYGNTAEDWDMENLSPSQQANLAGANAPMPKNRWEATFTGTKPAAKYSASQKNVYNQSAANFGQETTDYLKSRGVETGENVTGAQDELKKDYDQRMREIASKSHDIYAQTLMGPLMSQVSDYGQQASQLAGLTGQASAAWNAGMDQRWSQENALWQQAQNGPANPWAQVAGTMLPWMFMGTGGGGTPPPYYGSEQTYNPGMTSMGYMG